MASSLLVLFCVIGAVFSYKCSNYKNSGHTMCKGDKGVPHTLNQSEQDEVVDFHNDLRAQVSPPASQMMKLYWDDELATIATKWAAQCVVGHDSYSSRKTVSMGDLYIGQNGAFGYTSFKAAIQGWYDEVKDFTYGESTTAKVGHFTQVTNENAARIGCGYADCSAYNDKYPVFYFCNYARAQFTPEKIKPWTEGSTCSNCPNNCVKGLCDCQGVVCETNFGKVNPATCEC